MMPTVAEQIPLFSLHGKMIQKKRTTVYEKFMSSSNGVLLCTDVASRGLDIPDVDIVIQLDAPQKPEAFLHRCGRTARQGRSGTAIIYLQPHEDTYIEFMKLRKVPIEKQQPVHVPQFWIDGKNLPSIYQLRTEELSCPEGKISLTQFAHLQLLTDRDLYLKSIMAFVSYLKFYQEHQLKYIFRFQSLAIGNLMRSFFLLRKPSSPEIRRCGQVKDFQAVISDANIDKIPFKDKQREKQRLAKLSLAASNEKTNAKRLQPGVGDSWSNQKAAKQRRNDRREKKQRKREAAQQNMQTNAPKTSDTSDNEDWEALQAEERLAKKLKSGKMSKEEFDRAVDLDDMSDVTE
jgi:ATP-dependent RNA helicase DDX55/SPB4